MMGKPGINAPKVKDFRLYDNFFNDLLDGNVIAMLAELVGADSLEDFRKRLAVTNWEALIDGLVDLIYPIDYGLTVVRTLRKHETSGEDIPDEQRDVLNENILLFCAQGLPYRDFSASVKAGDTGRIEHILSLWTTQLHGTRNINYPREMLHFTGCIQKLWTPTMRDLWRRNALVNPAGRAGAWMPDDLFGEYVVREIKAKIHASSNLSSDVHLRETIACQVMSLYACKRSIARECRTKASTHSTLMNSRSDVLHIAATLIKEKIAMFQPGRVRDEVRDKRYWQAADMFGDGAAKLATGTPLRIYKEHARYNWHAGGHMGLEETGEDEDEGTLGEEITLDDLL